ncbi:hypothetical protein NDU88_004314 [Pleurodeles waltl]|uniref:Uncharacterized protein n=1 Tax=Pleurodeles waltl TaxID=8319 RepID=A0AAV7WW70_PLEWA|nr:hypothetical protein NDU88_004314 [Pleurodeles waltl]
MEQQHRVTGDQGLLSDIKAKIDEYHEQAQHEVEHLGKYAVARIYWEGERPGATLAAAVCLLRDDTTMLEIQDEQGHPVYDTEVIFHRFCRYYSNLYMVQLTTGEAEVNDYLAHIAMKWLTN